MKPRRHTLDDHGRSWQYAPAGLVRAAKAAGVDKTQLALAQRPMRKAETWLVFLWLGAVPFAGICFLLTIEMLPARWCWVSPAIMLAIAAGVHALAAPFLLRRAHRLASLDLSLCPSCGYDLSTLHAEQDGCCVCPECGGAWKLE